MRVVLDTGVVVSALLFSKGRLSLLRDQWTAGAITPLVSRDTIDELIRVLAYPRFELTREEIEAVLSAYLPYCETVAITPGQAERLPTCDDPDDQNFLDLASSGEAGALVAGDRDLLRLHGETPVAILSPAELQRQLGG